MHVSSQRARSMWTWWGWICLVLATPWCTAVSMASSWRGVLNTESARVTALGQERCRYVEVKKKRKISFLFLKCYIFCIYNLNLIEGLKWRMTEHVQVLSCSRTLCQRTYLAIWTRVRFPGGLVAGLAALLKTDNTISHGVSYFIRSTRAGPYIGGYEFTTCPESIFLCKTTFLHTRI